LSRVERVVGVFVSLATLLLLFGFGYYVYHTGLRKGWWTFKARYHTMIDSGAGLAVGGEVRLLGFSVGRITKVEAMPPFSPKAVYIEFYVLDPYQGYVWTDSRARVMAGDFLGGRYIEVTPGGSSIKPGDTNVVELHASYKLIDGNYHVYNEQSGQYEEYTDKSKGFWLVSRESPAVTERLEAIAGQAEEALPGILDLTNRVNLVLSNLASVTAEATTLLSNAAPILSNVTEITGNLRDPEGSFGEWALPANLRTQLLETLSSANVTLTNASRMIANTDTNVLTLVTNLDKTLVNLASITSNLNEQVQSNTNLVKGVSDLITNANDMIQGLKRHWLLRSAFKNEPEETPQDENSRRPKGNPPPRAGKWRGSP
jgi:ABC-type transporter Mla subunit MlaD